MTAAPHPIASIRERRRQRELAYEIDPGMNLARRLASAEMICEALGVTRDEIGLAPLPDKEQT